MLKHNNLLVLIFSTVLLLATAAMLNTAYAARQDASSSLPNVTVNFTFTDEYSGKVIYAPQSTSNEVIYSEIYHDYYCIVDCPVIPGYTMSLDNSQDRSAYPCSDTSYYCQVYNASTYNYNVTYIADSYSTTPPPTTDTVNFLDSATNKVLLAPLTIVNPEEKLNSDDAKWYAGIAVPVIPGYTTANYITGAPSFTYISVKDYGFNPQPQNVYYSPIPIDVVPQVPLISIDTPTNNSNVISPFNLSGWALNQSGIKEVDIYVDGVNEGTATLNISRMDIYDAYKDYNSKNSGYNYLVDLNTANYGNHTVDVKAIGNDGTVAVKSIIVNIANSSSVIGVQYQTHVQSIGWQNWISDGQEAGTDGKSLRVEALKIELVNAPLGAIIKYQAHVQSIGWQNWVSNGQEAGTDGRKLRVEAIKITLQNMPGYSVQYQAHVQSIGWQNWVSDGQEAGTDGRSLRIEAMRIRIVKL